MTTNGCEGFIVKTKNENNIPSLVPCSFVVFFYFIGYDMLIRLYIVCLY